MAYQALYRVWRSQRFDDILGQEAVTQTLKNAIREHQTSHAYLFTGPRGTGKTSAAKVFAKAINCHHSVDGEPCNECENCKSITEGRLLDDVIEIDAASNNGVEEIREIRDKVKYPPTKADYKVYIIDEVHMLSTGAFNALLKTLEEPPEHVIFILATTEPHKIPATIISRTQRFDFKRIPTPVIVKHLSDVLEKMEIPFEKEALSLIARSADGGMRDALSILDQAIAFGDEHVTLQAAAEVSGNLSTEMMNEYIQHTANHEVEGALECLHKILAEGKEAQRFIENVLHYLRDLLMYQEAPQFLAQEYGTAAEALAAPAALLAPADIYRDIRILNEAQQELRFSTNEAVYLEVATVRMAAENAAAPQRVLAEAPPAANVPEVAELEEKIRQLEEKVAALSESRPEKAAPPHKPVEKRPLYRVKREQVYHILQGATHEDLAKVTHHWTDLLQFLSITNRALLKASEPVAASPEGLILAFDYEILCSRAATDESLTREVAAALKKLVDYTPRLLPVPREEWLKMRKGYVEQLKQQNSEHAENGEEAVPLPEEPEEAADPGEGLVDQAVEMFGKDLIEVKED